MTPFYFDIETVPAQDPAIRAELRAAVTAPGNYSKPESIQKWLDENRDAVGDEQWLKTSFDGGVGQCVCIGYALGADAPQTFSVGDLHPNTEASMLAGFFEVLGSARHVQLVGHNIAGFDIPFLWKRAMVLGVKPSFNFPRNPKPWSELICDTLTLWDSQQRAGGSMDRLCKLMGIPGKGDFSGADVWPAIERGEFERVAAYCRDDVERTRAMHRRMTFAEAGATVPGARITQGQRVEVRV
jgi:predicted PolB exonuclease-like 3'-5' exonuclease